MLTRFFIACCLFVVVLYAHAGSRVIVATDSMWSIYLAQSLINDGDLILDEYRPLAKEKKNYGLRKRKGQLYSYFPAGTALMAVPFVWAYNETLPDIAEKLPGFPRGEQPENLTTEKMNLPLQRLIASIFVAFTAALIFFYANHFISLLGSVSVALIAAFCTPLWSTASRGLWQHGPSALLIAASILMILQVKRRPIVAGFSGALLAFAYIVRPTNAIAFICLGLYLALNSREALRVFVVTSLIIFIPFIAVSYDFFGRFLPPYYNANRLQIGWHLPQALLANLFSPNRGLFFLSPILIPALFSMYKTLKSFDVKSLSFAILVAFGGHLLAISLFPEWWGGHAFGARYMTETIPYVMFFLVLWLKEIRITAVRFGILFLSAGLSFLIHYKGATDFRTFLWNTYPVNIDRRPARVWDIRDLQFLR